MCTVQSISDLLFDVHNILLKTKRTSPLHWPVQTESDHETSQSNVQIVEKFVCEKCEWAKNAREILQQCLKGLSHNLKVLP